MHKRLSPNRRNRWYPVAPSGMNSAISNRAEGLAGSSWPALGSTAVLRLAEPGALEQATAIVVEQLDAIDLACSRFRTDSELSLANRRAGATVPIGALLERAVRVALRGAELTEGRLDPTLGLALEHAGYDRSWELMELTGPAGRATESQALIARRHRAWRAVRVSAGALRVPRGIRLDLGATAKALAAENACQAVHERLGGGVLVALGGDIATAGAAPDGGWQVHVTDDHRGGPAAPGQRVSLTAGGLATSSTVARRWTRRGRPMHHIIDPETGAPAVTRWRTVSVAAGDCVDANIASTGALLCGDAAPSWLSQRGLPARLVEQAGTVLTLGGWPQDSVDRPRTPQW